jgi:DNA-binding MarR family transcriptional regulator
MPESALPPEATGTPEATGVTARPAGAEAVTDSVIGLLRAVRKAKAHLMSKHGNVDSAMVLLLHTVAEMGPVRSSTLAGSVHSDLSTVSRQAATLVSSGLLERRADPVDGRAGLLALTPAGGALLAAHVQARAAFFEDVLDGWTEGDMAQFAALLARFTASYDRVHAARTTERPARADQAATTEGPLA